MNLGTPKSNGGYAKRPGIFGFVKAGYTTVTTIEIAAYAGGLSANH